MEFRKQQELSIINNFKDWANWSVPRQLSSQLVMLVLFSALEKWVASLLPLHNFCSIQIRLLEPSSSEAGETWVRNMAAELCLQSILFMLVRFFYMPFFFDMGQTNLLPLRRKSCYGFLSPLKIHRPLPGLNPRTSGKHATTRPPRVTIGTMKCNFIACYNSHVLAVKCIV
jgi:hypothetical protein